MKDLDIGEVAAATGVTPATLRYYEKKGLIAPSGRHGLRRIYDPSVLQILALIMLGQKAGFSLDEISGFISPKGQAKMPPEVLLAKADVIDRRIAELTALRDGLRHVAKCSAPTQMECPRFQRIMKVALSRIGSPASQVFGKWKT